MLETREEQSRDNSAALGQGPGSPLRNTQSIISLSSFFFFVFLPFLGPLLQHMDVPRLGVKLEL